MAVIASSSRFDRRRWARKRPDECPGLIEAKLRSGSEVRVIDISNGGVLIETASRILPGARVELFLMTTGRRWLLKGRIVRCRVAAIVPESGVRYRAALAFNEPVAIVDEIAEPASNAFSEFDRVQAFAVLAPSPVPAAS